MGWLLYLAVSSFKLLVQFWHLLLCTILPPCTSSKNHSPPTGKIGHLSNRGITQVADAAGKVLLYTVQGKVTGTLWRP